MASVINDDAPHSSIGELTRTYLALRSKPHTDDEDLRIIKEILQRLRSRVTRADLIKLFKDKRKEKTVRSKCKVREVMWFPPLRECASVGDEGQQPTAAEASTVPPRLRHKVSLQWQLYYVKVHAIRQARRWLFATEQKDAIEESPQTPRLVEQLAADIKSPQTQMYSPFGHDLEVAYGPIISRLLASAELHHANKEISFQLPQEETMPLNYRALQRIILERRREAKAAAPTMPLSTSDLATMLRNFCCNSCTTHTLVHFALPRKQVNGAFDVVPRTTKQAAPTVHELLQGSQRSPSSAASERNRQAAHALTCADVLQISSNY